jgi:hypothetical protein
LRRVGRAKISEHWPGTADGVAALLRAANAQ